MITYTTSKTDKELDGILQLQKNNLPQNLTQEEIQKQGFVTVSHTFEDLKKMNGYEQSIIVKDEDKIVGYLLAMTKKSKSDIPILVPMFEIFDKIIFKEKSVSEYNYMVVGQVCIQKEYRGMGLLDNAYQIYKNHFKDKYDFAITEIASHNLRSLKAHARIGFSEIHTYHDIKTSDWSIVVWDWQNENK